MGRQKKKNGVWKEEDKDKIRGGGGCVRAMECKDIILKMSWAANNRSLCVPALCLQRFSMCDAHGVGLPLVVRKNITD